MIVYLQGTIHEVAADHVVLLVQGVGYQVFVSKSTLDHVAGSGASLALHTHFVVREDAQQLYGFFKAAEKNLFLKLIQVNSVGPKLAMSLLSGLSVEALADAIAHEDLVRLTAISGVGKKTAERIIVDLKDKIIEFLKPEQDKRFISAPTTAFEEALSALMNLGYSRQEAQAVLQKIPQAAQLSLEALVREGLRTLS